jgi:DNA-binding NarL/FixJ family response regulator
MSKSILIVDDHRVMAIGYKSILENNDLGIDFTFTITTSLSEAYFIITNPENTKAFDIIFLDRSMPAFADKKLQSGEDLIAVIRQFLITPKVVILTSIAEKFSVYDIIHKNRPDGMMVKSDADDETVMECVTTILQNQSYHSTLVREALKEEINTKGHFDTIDRQIITLLSQGFRNATIAEKLNLSASAVEKRKSKIKDYLDVKGNDENIIIESKRLGYI